MSDIGGLQAPADTSRSLCIRLTLVLFTEKVFILIVIKYRLRPWRIILSIAVIVKLGDIFPLAFQHFKTFIGSIWYHCWTLPFLLTHAWHEMIHDNHL